MPAPTTGMPHAWPTSGRTGVEQGPNTRAEPGPNPGRTRADTPHGARDASAARHAQLVARGPGTTRHLSHPTDGGDVQRAVHSARECSAPPHRTGPRSSLAACTEAEEKAEHEVCRTWPDDAHCPAEAGEPPRTPPTGCMQPQEGATNLRVQVRPDGAHCPAEAAEPSTKAAHCRTAATGRGGTPACTAPVSPSDDVGCDGGNASCYMTPLRRMARRPAAPSSISTTEEGSGVGRLGSTVPPL